jgi:hypothetical protein
MSNDSLERRDWFVNAAARKAKALGAQVSTEALQRQMAADLTLLDNARAAGAIREKTDTKKKSPDEILANKRSLKAEAQAKELGGRVRRRKLPARDTKRRGIVLTGVEAQKLHAIVQRLYLIGQRARTVGKGEDMEHAFQCPGLARRAAEAQINHDAQRGEYAGKSERDRFRIYFAELQKICDDSNAVFRFGWWVAK